MSDEENKVYFRWFFKSGAENKLYLLEMMWFDEPDYDQSKFLNEMKFSSRSEALTWLLAERERCDKFLRETSTISS
jgi:hypothetical protein